MNGENTSNQPPQTSLQTPPPLPPPVIQYATPVGLGPAQPGFGCWRRGNRVIVAKTGVPLPPICFKCGQPTRRYKLHSLTWHHPLLYLLILPGILIYAIVALCVQQKANIEIPVCETHYRKRRNWVIIAWLVLLAAIGIGIAGCAGTLGPRRTELLGGLCFLGGFLVAILAGIVGIYAGRIAYAKEIDAHWVQLGGAGEDFLNRLPSA
ncbi:MAG: hypothetical protein ABSH20_07395 [Tepidisphaeraceae bacterium]